ncbi:putative RNA methyltransferase [Gordonia polyisoprenivorans]|uniref:putative RNA methyltransferase n=1 Tax=Gordonia polyisoprenivorans TaxID=84595 RepID=UPI002FDE35AE
MDLTADHAALRCGRRHSFDIARHGYVALLDGRSGALRADTPEMVAARLRVHDAGVLSPVVEATATALADLCPASLCPADEQSPLIVDLGGGPGVYLRACLRRAPNARGVVIDLSKACARAAARGEPTTASVVADVWRQIPMRSGSAAVALSVFAPRNIAETARVLRAGGHLVIVAPRPDHLTELVGPLGMLTVGPDKDDRIEAALSPAFDIVDRRVVQEKCTVTAPTIADLVAMGPSAFHHNRAHIDEVADAVAGAHGGSLQITVAVTVTVCRIRGDRPHPSGPDFSV